MTSSQSVLREDTTAAWKVLLERLNPFTAFVFSVYSRVLFVLLTLMMRSGTASHAEFQRADVS